MRQLVLFESGSGRQIGVLAGDQVAPTGLPADAFAEAISRWAQSEDLPRASDAPIPVRDVTLLPPLAPGARVFCVAQNYPQHAAEAGGPSPSSPIVFFKPDTAFVGHGGQAVIPTVSTFFDYEGEIAVVIGRTVSHEPAASALSAVAGYTIANDGSARDLQPATLAGHPQVDWFAAKAIDRGSALGPGIVRAAQVGPPHRLRITTRHNGELVQDDTAASMTFPVPELIAFISRIATLRPGDIILTGTPAGVGKARGVALAPGDEVTVEVSGLGQLVTRYAAA